MGTPQQWKEALQTDYTNCLKDIAQVGVQCQFDPDVVKDLIPQVDATIVYRILENAGIIHKKATCESMTHCPAPFISPHGAVQDLYTNAS
ncbi:hypothetical protein EDD18DRAFT_1356281 [Armillaria luteobubalina]|uniref:Uncharacterized protein n=1 Tax=Armillaria luteobubalina TaxID=153913 RepID=A0AA39Q056_9AGAR|nr:hypothetical protein EDD18DRAFT_1356281 [Armillaria luteobubalina]